MNELQKKEFEMLCLLVSVCNQLKLKYYLVCGSALGAVKYGGFIPWDDDIDVALPRDDYELFIERAPALLPRWYFVQNYKTDPQFPLLGTKLRDCRTTFCEFMCGRLNINHGVFIDIFPLDGIWQGRKEQRKYKKARRDFDALRRVNLSYRRFSPSGILPLKATYFFIANRVFGAYGDTAKAVSSFDKFVSSFSAEESAIWCNHANSNSALEFAPREQYGDGIIAKFEGLDVRIPERYDEYLTQKYGDWRADLPEDQKFGHHFAEVIDLERPYTDYVEHLKNGKIRIKRPQ